MEDGQPVFIKRAERMKSYRSGLVGKIAGGSGLVLQRGGPSLTPLGPG